MICLLDIFCYDSMTIPKITFSYTCGFPEIKRIQISLLMHVYLEAKSIDNPKIKHHAWIMVLLNSSVIMKEGWSCNYFKTHHLDQCSNNGWFKTGDWSKTELEQLS